MPSPTAEAPSTARGIARRTIALGIGNLLITGIGFALPLALARLAAPEDYGRFGFVTALLATCSIFTLPGLATAVTQGAARGQHGTLRVASRDRVRRSWVAILVVAAAGLWSLVGADPATGIILTLAAPLMIPAYALDLAAAFLNGAHQYRYMMVVMIAAVAIPAVTVVGLLLADTSIVFLTLGYFVALGSTNAIALAFVRRRFVLNDVVDEALVAYGRRLSWISSLGAVQFFVDRLIIGLTLGFEQVAIYSIAKIFQQGLKAAWAAVNQQQFPALAARDPLAASTLTKRTLLPIWGGFVLVGGVAIAVVPMLIPFVFGSGYVASVTPARLLIAAVVIGIPGAQFEMMFRAVANERNLYAQRISFTIIQIGAVAGGALLADVNGASAGVLLAYATNSLIGWYLDRNR